jgi:hypothetical protein
LLRFVVAVHAVELVVERGLDSASQRHCPTRTMHA